MCRTFPSSAPTRGLALGAAERTESFWRSVSACLCLWIPTDYLVLYNHRNPGATAIGRMIRSRSGLTTQQPSLLLP
ncbi:hypothetical protein UY416_23435 [Paenibacillus polymyxa]|uniref:hypothetical protein n=1 Tax=Paenibacillus polymyxa TaxID=1406 RepID=UPI002AB34F0B|nr:hypothetical protein [Paenibacillus polymyxa]MDY8049247.1 hypothetical protein [Paenibacillus polymyxa]